MNVSRWWTRCGRFEPLISLRATGRIGEPEAAALDAHLAECPRCRDRAAALARTADALREWVGDAETVAVPSTLRDRWVRAVRESSEGAARGDRRAPGPVPERHRCRAAAGFGERWAWGAVAAAWALILLLQGTAPAPAPVRPAGASAESAVAWKALMLVLRGEAGVGPREAGEGASGPGGDRERSAPGVPQGRWEPWSEPAPTV